MLEEIEYQNPWWTTDAIPTERIGNIERTVLPDLISALDSDKIICLYGPRRVGKTTLMYSMMEHLLKTGVPANRILYASLDNSKIRLYLEEGLDDLVKSFHIEKLGHGVGRSQEIAYVFLDEVHKLKDWGDKIKYWYDLGVHLRFVISGSSTDRLLKGSGESLLGRLELYLVLPLLLSEICGENIDCSPFDLNELERHQQRLLRKKQDIQIKLNAYIHRGGFPEFINEESLDRTYQGLRTYRTLAINRDIIGQHDIREPRQVMDMFDLLTDHMAQRINYSSFADILKIKHDTVKSYMSYLEEAFLIYPAYQYSEKHVLSSRKEKKLFFFDHGLRNAVLLKDIDTKEESIIIENAIFIHQFHKARSDLLPKMFFWLDTVKNEVDLVAKVDGHYIPIEVKYQNQINDRDLSTVRRMMEKFGIQKGIVVTKDTLDESDGINLIPAWMFMLMN